MNTSQSKPVLLKWRGICGQWLDGATRHPREISPLSFAIASTRLALSRSSAVSNPKAREQFPAQCKFALKFRSLLNLTQKKPPSQVYRPTADLVVSG